MICPKCKSDTRVKDSRPHREDARVIVRRRECEGCGHRFNTQEGTVDIVASRTAKRDRAVKWRATRSAQQREALKADWRLRKAAGPEARETGKPVAEILREWGVAAPSRTASPNP